MERVRTSHKAIKRAQRRLALFVRSLGRRLDEFGFESIDLNTAENLPLNSDDKEDVSAGRQAEDRAELAENEMRLNVDQRLIYDQILWAVRD